MALIDLWQWVRDRESLRRVAERYARAHESPIWEEAREKFWRGVAAEVERRRRERERGE
jgi:hypothetical protein